MQFVAARKANRNAGPVALTRKSRLRLAWQNMDGLTEDSMEDLRASFEARKPDLFAAFETKRREEDLCEVELNLPGYEVLEFQRSDLAGDKAGGGIAIWCRQADGLMFEQHSPQIRDETLAFVNNERVWMTISSWVGKTAVCSLYAACQHPDNRFLEWNQQLYAQILQEASALRSKGYRIFLMGDMNAHVGDVLGQGVPGNVHNVNPNGELFINFLDMADMVHVNGACRVQGDWSTKLTKGLWTRQRGTSSSIVDFGSISVEHLGSVIRMEIDDSGKLGGCSDHNWCEADLTDTFITPKRRSHIVLKKDRWDILPDMDWTDYRVKLSQLAENIKGDSVEALASSIASCIYRGMSEEVELKSAKIQKTCFKLPPHIAAEFKFNDKKVKSTGLF